MKLPAVDDCTDLFADPIDLIAPAAKTRSGHGGAREGAGRKPLGYKKPSEVVEFEKARARNEAAKAERNEFDLAVLRRQYLRREDVQQAAATAIAAFAQSARSIADALESDGIAPDLCVRVAAVIDASLEDLFADLKKIAGEDDAAA